MLIQLEYLIDDEGERMSMNTETKPELTDRTLFINEGENADSINLSMDDIERMLIYHSRDNGNVPHTPESTQMMLAGILKKEYAIRRIYGKNVVRAHSRGDIHIHNMDMPDRSYCSGHSPSYVAKYGLSLPNLNSIAKPAKHADVLLEQLIKFAASMQGHFSGAIGFDAVNMFVAPYLVGLDDAKVKQLAQIVIYEFAQQAVARGGQVVFSDLNLYWEIPKHYHDVIAIGPGGKETGIPYKEYDSESKRFMRALMQVYLEGDGSGRPFFFPKADCHITSESVLDDEYLNLLGTVASVRGSPYFVFDRGNDPSISQCCRLKLKLTPDDINDMKIPWHSRFTALQNVTMNLPGMAFATGNETLFMERLYDNMMLAQEAHAQKLGFFDKLINLGRDGPLALLTMDSDGSPYVRYDKMKFLVGMVGLNEAVQVLTGEQLHESKNAMIAGTKIIAQMTNNCKEISKDLGFVTILEQTPAESTAHRFARLDMERYGTGLVPYVRGDFDTGGIYYTNSTYMNIAAPLSPIERVKMEGKFHPLIEAGAISHVWLGETKPDPMSVASFVRKTFEHTQNAQIAFSPEFTICNACNSTTRGIQDSCPNCHSLDVDAVTRVTGYFSKVSNWNIGKKAELRERYRVSV
jgi:anaerobic ribonucleoside-triphosphate reductase